jgi:hypothetical protein
MEEVVSCPASSGAAAHAERTHSVMGLFDYFAEIRATRELDELARRIARRIYTPLRQAAFERIVSMPQAEARGYLWAVARPLAVAEVAAATQNRRRLSQSSQSLLIDRARQRVVRNLLADTVRDRSWIALRRRAA